MIPPGERVEVGRYLRRDQAEDRALVILAMGLPYWVSPDDGLYSLRVEPAHAEAVARELANYEKERAEERRQFILEAKQEQEFTPAPLRRPSSFSLFVYAWVLAGFFLLQIYGPKGWLALGTSDSSLVLHGQPWRAVTALTLHADLGHLLANLAVGVIFAAALLPSFGVGWTWIGILLSGAAGNWINAWGFRAEIHRSIGASTAVFGGLGLLVGWQLAALTHRHATTRGRPPTRQLIIPIAAGLGLLAYLGVGTEQSRVDVTAHLFGMLCGILFGFLIGWGRFPQRSSASVQRLLAVLALLIPALAWWMAWKGR